MKCIRIFITQQNFIIDFINDWYVKDYGKNSQFLYDSNINWGDRKIVSVINRS